MTKGLKALEKLNTMYLAYVPRHIREDKKLNEDLFGCIETTLKALEIIKEKRVNIDVVIRAFYLDTAVEEGQGLKYYNCTANHESKPLIQEEYDLLKEVLGNE